ncbi:hypothetical protein GCM10010271_68040 [Streptomyces kurssanovii]|nr:hypothetical protein GCM10010271_68040 [Streptomyces kurssanovii]
MCPFSGVCASRDRHEERLRAHPHVAAEVLRLEHVSMALNEHMSLYGPAGSLYGRLTEDGRNRAVLKAFQAGLDQALYAVYEVRRITFVGRTKDCRRWHGKECAEPKWWCNWQRTARCRRIHTVVDPNGAPVDAEPHCPGGHRCRGKQQKGQTWRSVRIVYEGPRNRAEFIVGRFADRFPERVRLVTGDTSGIRRAHYLPNTEGLPRTEAFIVAAPAGVADKQRAGFEKKWTEHTGGRPVFPPLRELPPTVHRKKSPSGAPHGRHLPLPGPLSPDRCVRRRQPYRQDVDGPQPSRRAAARRPPQPRRSRPGAPRQDGRGRRADRVMALGV